MTRDEAKRLLPIIQAFAKGEDVQHRNYDGVWEVAENFSFTGRPEDYRIRPAPKKLYVCERPNGARLFVDRDRALATKFRDTYYPNSRVVEYVEVLNDA